MKKTAKITSKNCVSLIRSNDVDFNNGLTRFTFKNKNGFLWSFRFFKVKDGLFQTKQRLGHMKECYGYVGSLMTIMDYIINS